MEKNTNIHPTAIVDPKAQIGEGVTVGPYTVIGPDVVIGKGVQILDHCHLVGKTIIGKNCHIFTGTVLGSEPQDRKHTSGDDVILRIGENNIFREYVMMNPGTLEGGSETVIGDHNLFMAYSHVAHDCQIGNNCVLANAANLAGHVILEDNAIIGGLCGVHQFVRIGRLSILGACSKATQDIPPFSTCDGHPAKLYGLNIVGLRRSHAGKEVIAILKAAFKILFFSGLSKSTAVERIQKELTLNPEVSHLIGFVQNSNRGVSGQVVSNHEKKY